ncbi:MAG TPA: XDD4 family exosortase-dependent surface protein [Phycisphaerae bacterium]|nr:XDD4 family exosortase-dependent surface protein [Phycisphaerae bacterium]
MRASAWFLCTLAALASAPYAAADVIVEYTADAGGNNNEPLNGLAARATFAIDGNDLTILLENISTGVPDSFEVSDSLLVSLGINLPGVDILTGDAAIIGPDSIGLGLWSDRVAGDSVAEEWLWTNDFGGDLMEAYQHVISTSSGQGGGETTRFDGGSGTVNGPFGGIAADPPILEIPGNKPAVSDSIYYELTLTGTLTEEQLLPAANASIVEFGSDQRYLRTPEPASAGLLLVTLLLAGRRGLRIHI